MMQILRLNLPNLLRRVQNSNVLMIQFIFRILYFLSSFPAVPKADVMMLRVKKGIKYWTIIPIYPGLLYPLIRNQANSTGYFSAIHKEGCPRIPLFQWSKKALFTGGSNREVTITDVIRQVVIQPMSLILYPFSRFYRPGVPVATVGPILPMG